MWFVVIGVAVLLLKHFGVPPVGGLDWADDWWLLLSPFALAVAWWTWADKTGWTSRKAMERADQLKEERRQKHMDEMGLSVRSRSRKK